VTDARRALEDCDRLAGFDAAGRTRFWEAVELSVRVIDLKEIGKAREAVDMAKKVLALYESLLGENHPAYAESLNNLAELYQAMGDYPKALPLFQEARAITKKALGTNHPDHARILNNLAALYRAMGDYPKALPLYEEARAIWKRGR
jgi:tetratricopeptide (TPR) repeat protein